MTNTFTLPTTAEEAVTELGSLGLLMNATGWKKAAIVAALVGPATGPGRKGRDSYLFPLTIEALLERRITGLRDRQTVMRYRDAWFGERDLPTLGDKIDLDGLPDWPPNLTVGERAPGMTPERRDTLMKAGKDAGMPSGSKVVDVAANPKAMAAAIKADPQVEAAAREALGQADDARHDRLRPGHGTPEGKAAQARMRNANDVADKITIPLGDACVVIQQIGREWDDNFHLLSENDKRVIARTINDIIVAAEAIRLHMEVGEMT